MNSFPLWPLHLSRVWLRHIACDISRDLAIKNQSRVQPAYTILQQIPSSHSFPHITELTPRTSLAVWFCGALKLAVS